MGLNHHITLEVCVDSVESAVAAQTAGADRVELCQALLEGGLTPSAGLIEEVRARVALPLAVMIRARGADFCYSHLEFAVMKRDLLLARKLGADIIVFGLLNPDGRIDRARTRELLELARPLPVTFHRAFDMSLDPREALETLVDLGVSRVLTSGQESSALGGIDRIAELVRLADQRLIVVPGGGITEQNLLRILRESGAREFHVSASSMQASRMTFRNPRVRMPPQLGPSEYEFRVADKARLHAFRDLADRLGSS